MSATLLRRRAGTGRAVARARRHFRVRKQVRGTADHPRLVVTRSLRHVTAQVVDDTRGHTLVSASSMDPTIRAAVAPGGSADRPDKKAVAAMVGALVADRAKAAGIGKVVFDRAGNRYAGRLASLAEAARQAGLEF